ncbi:CEP164, partial [Symbiodinium sp. CCMP2456]
THPLEHVFQDTYKTIVNWRSSNMSVQERADALSELQAELRQMHQETQEELAKWSEHQDELGNTFYFNQEAGPAWMRSCSGNRQWKKLGVRKLERHLVARGFSSNTSHVMLHAIAACVQLDVCPVGHKHIRIGAGPSFTNHNIAIFADPSMAFTSLAACSRSKDGGCCTSTIGSRNCSVTSWTKPDML